MTDRTTFISYIRASLIAERPDHAQKLARSWLDRWPGDSEIKLLQATAHMEQGHYEKSTAILEKLIIQDPELENAYRLLAISVRHIPAKAVMAGLYEGAVRALSRRPISGDEAPAWVSLTGQSLQSLDTGDNHRANALINEALMAEPSLPLVQLAAINISTATGNGEAATSLALSGHERWPDSVPFQLLTAGSLLKGPDINRGVAMLHQAAVQDPTGSLAKKYLGADHPYSSLWPAELEVVLAEALPAEISSVLGLNQLPLDPTLAIDKSTSPQFGTKTGPAGSDVDDLDDELPVPEPWEAFQGPAALPMEATPAATSEETLLEVEREFNRIANRLNPKRNQANEDSRHPVYILLSSRTRLHQQFGADGYVSVLNAMQELTDAVERRPDWSAVIVLIDDPDSLTPFKLKPADPGNAWQIKLRLADLDEYLANRNRMIGALLIIGDDQIIPFHGLPNPTDDDDEFVASDNPYSTTDENYFAPEWPVGRLPSTTDEKQIIEYLEDAADYHRRNHRPIGPLSRLKRWLYLNFGRWLTSKPRALGYSASIWRKASLAVFRSIGDPGQMLTSPPTEASKLPPITAHPMRLSYFNLHGLEDSPEWFGQRDPLRDQHASEEFPIALRPSDVVNSGRAPTVVFTEACYGANIQGKSVEDALCLKFLNSGTRAIIGSTKISYGSVTPPLIAADLIGQLLWENINRGTSIGESLRRAKLSFAAEMHRRQGFLDGEDQKTLISFLLYGDPLFVLENQAVPNGKSVIRKTTRPKQMKTACSLGPPERVEDVLDSETFARVKSIVSQYLPGMEDAQCHAHANHEDCDGVGHACPTHQLGAKSNGKPIKGTVVVTLSKNIPSGDRNHPHFARLTLDNSGKVMKLAVSR
jgi:tetratricopeptide (TPR) repeat protein